MKNYLKTGCTWYNFLIENIGHVIFPLVDSEKREALKYELIFTNQP